MRASPNCCPSYSSINVALEIRVFPEDRTAESGVVRAPVGEIDASVGEGGGDLFGRAPRAFVVEGVMEGEQVDIDGLDDWADPAGAMSR